MSQSYYIIIYFEVKKKLFFIIPIFDTYIHAHYNYRYVNNK